MCIASSIDKQDTGADQGTDEMDIGDMDKLEQDTGNIGEVNSKGMIITSITYCYSFTQKSNNKLFISWVITPAYNSL